MHITFEPCDQLSPKNKVLFDSIFDYIFKFLTAKHPARSGSVCPFVEKAITGHALYFGIVERFRISDLSIAVETALHKQKIVNADKGINGSIILLFNPPVERKYLLDIQKKKMLRVMDMGLMLGMFGPEDDSPSFHHQDFHPFRAPQNILVVRDMITHDAIMLNSNRVKNKKRLIKMIEAYIKKFQDAKDAHERNQIRLVQQELERIRSRPFWHFW